MILQNISLLTSDEILKYAPMITLTKDDWWLKTPEFNTTKYVCTVDFAGFFDRALCWLVNRGVRPVGIFEMEVSNPLFWHKPEVLVGSKVEFGKYSWTVLDVKSGGLYALCDDIVAYHCFDEKTNVWEKSELKHWLETDGLKLCNKEV